MNRRWLFIAVGVIAAVSIAMLLSGRQKRRPSWDDSSVGLTRESANVRPSTPVGNQALPWSRFRGPNGTGISDAKAIPIEWSDSKNLLWKSKLPGLGASSPILTEQFVFVTSYSGYGEQARNTGDPKQLKRQLSCVDRRDGAIVWTRTIENVQLEDSYRGAGLPEHGYATNSPVTDGQTVFAFLGKSGVVAFDLQGNELWRVSVGTDSSNRAWGSAASLTLYDDLVIVNAAEESRSIVALDKATGGEVWKAEASTLELCYSTPAIVRVDQSRDDLVIAVPGEIWGLNPRNGKLNWFVATSLSDNLSPSVIVDGTTVFAFGGYRSSGSLAVQVGGQGDVTSSHVLWTSRNSSYVATPVLIDRRLYWIDNDGIYYCADADTGALVHRARTPGISGGGQPVYASPIAIAGKIYIQSRSSGVFVVEPSDELKIIAQNKFDSDSSIFNATPAVDAGQLFLRSNEFLYCVGN